MQLWITEDNIEVLLEGEAINLLEAEAATAPEVTAPMEKVNLFNLGCVGYVVYSCFTIYQLCSFLKDEPLNKRGSSKDRIPPPKTH
jgi:hypothetical protein